MTIATRHICLAIVLGLLASHAGIAAHTASHLSGDGGECEYCMAYGDTTIATGAANERALPVNGERRLSAIHVAPPVSRQVLPFRPRGPPLDN